jgi:thymidylate synthase (FAD)
MMKYVKILVPDDFDDKLETVKIEYNIKKQNYPDEANWKSHEATIWRPQYRTILDKGYLGLVDFMGDDQTVVDAARMSYGKGTRRVQEDRGLIRYLVRNRHWTPIEMVEIMWHVKAPIFVFRQWHRHRMASINEYSARYSVLSDDVYMPTQEDMKPQSISNRQGRDGVLSEDNSYACQLQLDHSYKESIQAYRYLLGETDAPSQNLLRRRELVEDIAINHIKKLEQTDPAWAPELVTPEMIDKKMREIGVANGLVFTDEEFHGENGNGLSRELARVVMPLGSYSEMYWKSDLRNTMNFLSLRCDPHAQYEIRAYADAMLEMMEPIAPACIAAFIDYQLKGRSISRMELDVIRKLYSVAADGDNWVALTIEETMKEAGASAREIREFIDVLSVPSSIE